MYLLCRADRKRSGHTAIVVVLAISLVCKQCRRCELGVSVLVQSCESSGKPWRPLLPGSKICMGHVTARPKRLCSCRNGHCESPYSRRGQTTSLYLLAVWSQWSLRCCPHCRCLCAGEFPPPHSFTALPSYQQYLWNNC